MQLFRHKNFTKEYHKLSIQQKSLVDKAIFLFHKNPLDIKLRNHQLKGKYKGCHSIDAAFDLRIIFKKDRNYTVVVFLKIGSHNRRYH